MTHLNFDLKKHFNLIAGDRWNILTILLLHCNIRNRCFVGMDTIAELATNGNLAKATKAKKWLIRHKAIELVPYSKRIEKERDLPARQHVYQLTGEFTTCDDPNCCKEAGITVQYLYFQQFNVSDGENINVSDGENFNGENLSSTNRSKTNKKKPKDSAPQNGAGGETAPKANPMYDAIKAVWGYTGGLNGDVAKWLAGTATKKEYKEYNLIPAVTPEELLGWRDWWTKANPGMSLLEKRDRVQSSIYAYREHLAKRPPKPTWTPPSGLSDQEYFGNPWGDYDMPVRNGEKKDG